MEMMRQELWELLLMTRRQNTYVMFVRTKL